MSSLIEQLSLLFGGGNLYDGPPMEANSESNVPRERVNVPPEKARVPTYEQSQAEARTSARVDSGTGRPQPKRNATADRANAANRRMNPPPKQGPPSRLANAAQHTTPTFTDSSGNKVPVPEGYRSGQGMDKILKPLGKFAKVAGGAPVAALTAAFTAEKLGIPEHQQDWIDRTEPEGFTASTVITRDALNASQLEMDEDAAGEVAKAQAKVDLMKEVGANPELIAEAEAELAAVTSVDPNQSILDFEAEVNEDLANNQAMIDSILTEVGNNPELAKARIEQQGLLRKKEELQGKLDDAGLIRDQRTADSIKDKAEGDPEADAVIKAAGKVDIGELTRQLQLKGIGEKDFKDLTDKTAKGWLDGIPLQEMMKGAASFLGELWDDEAIQHAFVYYMGARLMGYSGSGSGMAAGQVLLKGWDNKAKSDLALGVSDAKAAEAKLKSQTLDMSKTVKMFNPRTNQIIEGYAAPNGNFQEMGSDKTYAAKDLDYLTYDSSRHKTREEMSKELMTSTTNITNKTLANIRTQSIGDNPKYTSEQYKQVDDLFGDGNAARDVILQVTRAMDEAGVKTNTLAFRSAIEGTIQRQIRDVASGKYKGTEMVADLVGKVNEDMLKADLKGEGGIPDFIYGKATKWSKAGVENVEDGFEMPPADSLRLHTKSTAITRDIIDYIVRNDLATPAKARHLITKQKTIKELGAVFQEVVMQSPENIKYWTDQATEAKTNAFSVWLDSAGKESEQKYMGLNNPIALKKVNEFYKKLIKKDK